MYVLCVDIHDSQKRVLDSLELKFLLPTCLWVLETKPRS